MRCVSHNARPRAMRTCRSRPKNREHTTLVSNLTATANGHVFICSNASSLFVRVPPITNECPLPPPFAYSTSFPRLLMLPSYPSASPSHSEKRKKIQLGSQYCKLYRCPALQERGSTDQSGLCTLAVFRRKVQYKCWLQACCWEAS
jgi:hypothetical protein